MAGEEGVLYGDARHFYGGLEPAIMPSFTITKDSDNNPVMNCTTPSDTVIYKQTLCTVAGVKIVANLYHEPEDEFDGETLRDLLPDHEYTNVVLPFPPNVNILAETRPTIFYKAFPYSTNNVFRRSSKNCQVFNPPPDLISFTSTQSYNDEKTGFDVNLSMTFDPVITKVIVGRVPGEWTIEQLKEAKLTTPQDFETTFTSTPQNGVALITDDTASEVEGEDTFTYVAFPIISNDVSFLSATNIVQVTLIEATPPPLPKYVNVVSLDREGYIRLDYDIDVDENTPLIYGTLVFKTKGYPTSLTDGTVWTHTIMIYNPSATTRTYHWGPHGALRPETTIYFRVFPYTKITNSTTGEEVKVYNASNSENTRCQVTMRKHSYLFGFDLDEEDPDPATRISYPDDVDNYGWTPITSLGYNSWINVVTVAGKYFMPRPCMLKYTDDTILEYLDPTDYRKTIDGTTSHITDRTCGANAMMEWPKIYTKRWKDSNSIYHFRISDMAIDSAYDCWCNWNKNDKTVGHFYTAIYPTNNQVDLPRSLSGLDFDKSGAPGWVTFENFTGYEEVLTPNGWYGTLLFSQAQLMTDLLLLCFRSNLLYKIISTYSNNNSGLSPTFKTGFANTNGLWRMGTTPNYSKLFGMEYLIGWGYTPLLGYSVYYENVNNLAKTYYVVKITPGRHDGSTSNDFSKTNMNQVIRNTDTLTQLGFMKKGETLYTGNGYVAVTKMDVYPWGRIPSTQSLSDSGSATTYEAVYEFLRTPAEIQQYYYIMFGASNAGYSAGPTWLCSITSARLSNQKNNAILRLTCIPPTSDKLNPNDVKYTDPPIPPKDTSMASS